MTEQEKNIAQLLADVDVSELTPAERKILEKELIYDGKKTGKEIAKEIGVGQEWVYTCRNNPRYQKVYQKIKSKMFANQLMIVQDVTLQAVNELKKIIEKEDIDTKLKAIKMLLDYSAKVSPTATETRTSSVQLNQGLL